MNPINVVKRYFGGYLILHVLLRSQIRRLEDERHHLHVVQPAGYRRLLVWLKRLVPSVAQVPGARRPEPGVRGLRPKSLHSGEGFELR